VVTWGKTRKKYANTAYGYRKFIIDPDPGGVQPQLTSVQIIYSNPVAFAAKKADDSAVTWGHKYGGGDSSKVDLTSVDTIFGTDRAFAAKKKG